VSQAYKILLADCKCVCIDITSVNMKPITQFTSAVSKQLASKTV